MFINSEYLDRDILNFKTDKQKRLETILKYNGEFIKAADKIKEVFKKFDGKVADKRIETALKQLKIGLYIVFERVDQKIFPNQWDFHICFDYDYKKSVFYLYKIERVNAEEINNIIDREVERTKHASKKIKDDIKNIDKKLKKLYKLADDFNALMDDFSPWTIELLQLKNKRIY